MEKIKIYSPGQIGGASFWAGPLAGIYLLKKNFDALGNKIWAKKTIIWGTIYTAGMFLLIFLVPKEAGLPLELVNVNIAWQLARRYQMTKKDIQCSEQYGFQSNWKVFWTVVVSAIVTIAIIAVIVIFTPASLSIIKQDAQRGDAESQYELGMFYYEGDMGLKEDKTEAVKWLRKSADQGMPEAQHNLGVAYHEGSGGLPQDEAEAFKWWRKAADQGFAESQYNLGIIYSSGVIVKPDIQEAKKWFQKAADQGDEDAKEELKKLQVRKAD